jgi:hypothetical protein
MQNGVIHCERLDMLVADLYPIATWGKVDLVKDKVSMAIGLTGQALQQAFEIRNLESDYMLQIPVKGPTGNVQIDKSKATTRISTLVAQTQGGLKGKIFGTVLQIAAGDGNDPRPPPPTTTPFPWSGKYEEQAYFDQQMQPNQENQRSDRRPSTPFHRIKEGASSLINEFLER